jgi:hypothetical protein
MLSGDPMIGAFDKANEEVTCMQRLLAAEDALAREISLLLQITDKPSLVVPHISPSIRSRLCGAPEGTMDLPLFSKTSPSPARPAQKSSIAPPISFCGDSGLAGPSEVKFIPFHCQVQQRRHKAYGI